VFLTEVRSPEDDEIAEGGYTDLSPWPRDLAEGAWGFTLQVLRQAGEEVLAACQSRNDKQLSMLRDPARETAAPCGYGVARSGDRQGSKSRVCVRAVVNEDR